MRNTYADPTANTAIANVDRERRREERLRDTQRRVAERPASPAPKPKHRPTAGQWRLVWTDKGGKMK